jgi:hypothetical protein
LAIYLEPVTKKKRHAYHHYYEYDSDKDHFYDYDYDDYGCNDDDLSDDSLDDFMNYFKKGILKVYKI